MPASYTIRRSVPRNTRRSKPASTPSTCFPSFSITCSWRFLSRVVICLPTQQTSYENRKRHHRLVAAMPRCAIGRFGVGYDNIDLPACTEHDIAVYITRNGVIRPVASSIVTLVLALSHNLVGKDRLIRRGDWTASTRRIGKEPRGRVVGTVGFGNIAREAVRLLKALEIGRFLTHDPFANTADAAGMGVEVVPLDELLAESDYVLI